MYNHGKFLQTLNVGHSQSYFSKPLNLTHLNNVTNHICMMKYHVLTLHASPFAHGHGPLS